MVSCLHEIRTMINRARILALLAIMAATEAAASDGAVVVMYHRFGDGAYPSTNITLEQFDAHIAYLQRESFNVLPLPEILDAMKSGRMLPDKTVAITVDDAYLSVYEQGWPRLRQAGYPLTLFVATQAIDNGGKSFMTWDQIREMRDAGVTIGSQTETHLHMARAGDDRNREDLQRSQARFTAELGAPPVLFAYPYGEASAAARALVIDSGFIAAFGQHSGVAHRSGDPYFLPRFAFNEHFGDLDHFRQRVRALPLPVSGITPADPLVASNPPAFGFTVDAALKRLGQLACYHPQFKNVTVERLGTDRFEIRFPGPLRKGRSRLNCTVPGTGNRYHWFGWQFYVGK